MITILALALIIVAVFLIVVAVKVFAPIALLLTYDVLLLGLLYVLITKIHKHFKKKK